MTTSIKFGMTIMLSLLAYFATPASAQESLSKQLQMKMKSEQLDFQSFDFSMIPKKSKLLTKPLTIESLNLNIPSTLSPNKSKEALDLFKRLAEICPECSTGGTVGGGVVVGPNFPGSGTPTPCNKLFHSDSSLQDSNGLVTITKKEYDSLKLAATAFHSQKNK